MTARCAGGRDARASTRMSALPGPLGGESAAAGSKSSRRRCGALSDAVDAATRAIYKRDEEAPYRRSEVPCARSRVLCGRHQAPKGSRSARCACSDHRVPREARWYHLRHESSPLKIAGTIGGRVPPMALHANLLDVMQPLGTVGK